MGYDQYIVPDTGAVESLLLLSFSTRKLRPWRLVPLFEIF